MAHRLASPPAGLWKSRAFLDAVWIIALFGTILVWAIRIEAFDHVVDFSEHHENWELDEILTTLMVMPVALVVYALRRLSETRSELVRRLAAERAASEMALHDPLTGLPNRRKAAIEIARAIESSAAEPVSLLMIDLNRFKRVNDLHGHAAGDELLLSVGERLVKAAGRNASVYRFGGDEFCVLLRNSRPDEELLARVEAISLAFEPPVELKDLTVAAGASIGVTSTCDPGVTMDELLTQADAAMYRTKHAGRNGFGFFEEGMEVAAVRRAKIESDLRTAIAEQRIEAHFQPQVRLCDGAVIGFEALARWRLPDGSCRLPDEFIAIAEEAGFISDIFFAVLRHSARAARDWPADTRFAVNLSPVQLGDPWLVERILQVLVEEGISPGRLEIEVTENALVADFDVARDIICSLKNQGIHVSLDDFGTGYSSLRHLSELPFDKIKIDKSFIQNLAHDPSAQAIVRTVTGMAHSLGLTVTAEGIETEGNARSVADFGCDVGQGFLFGRPNRSMADLDRASETEPGRDGGEPDATPGTRRLA